MAQLDIFTPKGQETLSQEREAARIWGAAYPDIEYRETDKDKPVRFDAYLIKNGKVRGIAETKCRDVTLEAFERTFRSEWLITMEKLLDCIRAANAISVPFVGFLYLVPSKVLLWQTLWKPEEPGIIPPYRVENTQTQATVNGGKAHRLNAYIDMRQARRLR